MPMKKSWIKRLIIKNCIALLSSNFSNKPTTKIGPQRNVPFVKLIVSQLVKKFPSLHIRAHESLFTTRRIQHTLFYSTYLLDPFNILLQSETRSFNCSVPFNSSRQNSVGILLSSHARHKTPSFHKPCNIRIRYNS
jgi:hypothetical protein